MYILYKKRPHAAKWFAVPRAEQINYGNPLILFSYFQYDARCTRAVILSCIAAIIVNAQAQIKVLLFEHSAAISTVLPQATAATSCCPKNRREYTQML